MSEKLLTNKIIKTLNKLPGTWVYKRYAPAGNESGQPDITGISHGKRVEIEVKSPDRVPSKVRQIDDIALLIQMNLKIASKHQRYYIKKYDGFGALTGVVTSIDQAVWIVNEGSEC